MPAARFIVENVNFRSGLRGQRVMISGDAVMDGGTTVPDPGDIQHIEQSEAPFNIVITQADVGTPMFVRELLWQAVLDVFSEQRLTRDSLQRFSMTVGRCRRYLAEPGVPVEEQSVEPYRGEAAPTTRQNERTPEELTEMVQRTVEPPPDSTPSSSSNPWDIVRFQARQQTENAEDVLRLQNQQRAIQRAEQAEDRLAAIDASPDGQRTRRQELRQSALLEVMRMHERSAELGSRQLNDMAARIERVTEAATRQMQTIAQSLLILESAPETTDTSPGLPAAAPSMVDPQRMPNLEAAVSDIRRALYPGVLAEIAAEPGRHSVDPDNRQPRNIRLRDRDVPDSIGTEDRPIDSEDRPEEQSDAEGTS